MPWFKLDCQFFTDDKIRHVTVVTRYAVTCVFGYVKAFGSGGKVNADPEQIAAACMIEPQSVQDALKLPLFRVVGKEIQVVNWQRYNGDSTHAERQERYRERKRDIDGDGASPAPRDAGDYRTEQNRREEKREEEEIPLTPFVAEIADPEEIPETAGVVAAWMEANRIDPINCPSHYRRQWDQAVRAHGVAKCLEYIGKIKNTKPGIIINRIDIDTADARASPPPESPDDISAKRQALRESQQRIGVKK